MNNTEQVQYATGGANFQDGALPICNCKHCGNEIVWATSNRTGKKYPVDIQNGYNNQRFYIKSNFHNCRALDPKAIREDKIARLEEQYQEEIVKMNEWFMGILTGGTATKEEIVAATFECDAKREELRARYDEMISQVD